jgi:hypothetical protein
LRGSGPSRHFAISTKTCRPVCARASYAGWAPTRHPEHRSDAYAKLASDAPNSSSGRARGNDGGYLVGIGILEALAAELGPL